MGLCTKRRVYMLFLIIIIFQIVTTGIRQIFDFFGPLWSMIFTNFLNIVFAIFGFFGGFTKRGHYLISYIVWSLIWAGWNVFIICIYLPIGGLGEYKSSVLSLGTGGFSWWETRAPGCIPDWASETQLIITNCFFDPRIVEFSFAGVQVFLAILGILFATALTISPYDSADEKASHASSGSLKRGSPAVFYSSNSLRGATPSNSLGRSSRRSLPRSTVGGHHSGPGSGADLTQNHSQSNGIAILDDRLRPMTPRRVKRRSARSIQSQRYGVTAKGAPEVDSRSRDAREVRPGSSTASGRGSLRSNASRRSGGARSSKRKSQQAASHFVSPLNRLMAQQADSETSHDDPRPPRRPHPRVLRDLGHVNPVYSGPQSSGNSGQPPPPPRPPSARSSYSNYHPARGPQPTLPSGMSSNVFNLNQNLFSNPAFDHSPEYNVSQRSQVSGYEEESSVSFNPGPPGYPSNNNRGSGVTLNSLSPRSHPPLPSQRQNPMPNPSFFQNLPIPAASPVYPTQQQLQQQQQIHQQQQMMSRNGVQQQQQQQLNQLNNLRPLRISPASRSPMSIGGNPQPQLSYPLAHSPVSQESFPMWGVAQAQVPSPGIKQYHQVPHHLPNGMPPNRGFNLRPAPQNSETVI